MHWILDVIPLDVFRALNIDGEKQAYITVVHSEEDWSRNLFSVLRSKSHKREANSVNLSNLLICPKKTRNEKGFVVTLRNLSRLRTVAGCRL